MKQIATVARTLAIFFGGIDETSPMNVSVKFELIQKA